jgi:hypothetical protein
MYVFHLYFAKITPKIYVNLFQLIDKCHSSAKNEYFPQLSTDFDQFRRYFSKNLDFRTSDPGIEYRRKIPVFRD